MSWFADLAGKAENLLINFDEQTGAALRNHTIKSKKHDCLHNEPTWLQGTKKRTTRPSRKSTPSNYEANSKIPPRKQSPINSHQSYLNNTSKDEKNVLRQRNRKSPPKKTSPQYNLHNCPETLVGDIHTRELTDQYGLKYRRYSLPTDLELISNDKLTYNLQNLGLENAMLKNEFKVMNSELLELLKRLRKTEDGNDVVSCSRELSGAKTKLDLIELSNIKIEKEKDIMESQLQQLRDKIVEIEKTKSESQEKSNEMETEITILRNINKDLEDKIDQLNAKVKDSDMVQSKLEAELRHAQLTINELQGNLNRSNEECVRLEKDWETYKLRVKNMFSSKDNEIRALRDGVNLHKDTKALIEEIENLKQERENMSCVISRVRAECQEMKQSMGEMETRHGAAERVVNAMRDALKDERAARGRAEAQVTTLRKELKTFELDCGQTIASLRTALRDKESELNHLRETTSSLRTVDTSALNVADYDVTQQSLDKDKIEYLTQTLVQRQARLDALMADNNMLRIQMDKLQSRHKSELSLARAQHSVVEVGCVEKVRRRDSPFAKISAFSLLSNRSPLFRLFVVVYTVCLHLWVLTVLLASTPEGVPKTGRL